jgi:pimeloyl-ACP methyl ester carboxylesterase
MMQRFRTRDGLSLAYLDEGEGPVVLCLPGLTRNHTDFDDLAAALSGGQRLIRLVFRGRGMSDRDPDPMNYRVEVEAQDVLDFLDFLGIARVTIVGTSRGGLVAMALAGMAPDRIAGVVFNDIGPEIAEEGLARIMTYLGVAPRAARFEEAAAALEAVLGPDFPGVPRERWLICARRWFDMGEEGLVLNYDPGLRVATEADLAAPQPDRWPLFDALAHVPLAVVRGANSDLLSRETVARMKARRPDLIVAEVPDRGHVPFLDEPEAVAAVEGVLSRSAGG